MDPQKFQKYFGIKKNILDQHFKIPRIDFHQFYMSVSVSSCQVLVLACKVDLA